MSIKGYRMFHCLKVHHVGFWAGRLAKMKCSVRKYVIISVEQPITMNRWVFVSLAWALYICIVGGSNSTEPPCCTAIGAQNGQISRKGVFCIFTHASTTKRKKSGRVLILHSGQCNLTKIRCYSKLENFVYHASVTIALLAIAVSATLGYFKLL